MVKLLAVADDLTGANDAGAQFAAQGALTLVTMDEDYGFDQTSNNCDVLVVSAESRHLSAAEAASRVETLTRRARESGVSHFYKKTDSTLRGNIGAELEALLRSSKSPMLAFAPAFPRMGRFTRAGHQMIGERFLHQTEFAADPLNPITTSYLPEIIRQQTDIPVRVIDPNAGDVSIIAGELPWIAVFDANCDDDFQRIGESLRRSGLLGALAGSAGFAASLPRLLDLREDFKPVPKSRRGPMLVVSGSLNEVSLQQTVRGESAGFVALDLSAETMIGEDREQASKILEELIHQVAIGNDVILRTASRREDLVHSRRLGDRLKLRDGALHQAIARGVAAIVRDALAETRLEQLVVFGGDTLAAVMSAMGWRALLPIRETLPGVVLAKTVGGERELSLISKAGGFGSIDLLRQIKTRLRENS